MVQLLLFLASFNTLEHFAHKQTDGFTLQRVQFESKNPGGAVAVIPELNQPYHYLGCGNQCYAFLSDDGKYVLKLFKYASSPVSPALTKIPVLNTFKPFRPHRYQKMLWKRQRDIESYRLAFDRFREESGLIAAHLDPEANYPAITLYDKLRCKHTLNFSDCPFVLQHKAVPADQQFRAWRESPERLKIALEGLSNLFKKRIERGILDDDVNYHANIGFIGAKPIQIDPGNFKLGTVENPDEEISRLLEGLSP